MFKKLMMGVVCASSIYAAQYSEKEYELFKAAKQIVNDANKILGEKYQWDEPIHWENGGPNEFAESGLLLDLPQGYRVHVVAPFGEFTIAPSKNYSRDYDINELIEALKKAGIEFGAPKTGSVYAGHEDKPPFKSTFKQENRAWPVTKVGNFTPEKYVAWSYFKHGSVPGLRETNKAKMKAMTEHCEKEKSKK